MYHRNMFVIDGHAQKHVDMVCTIIHIGHSVRSKTNACMLLCKPLENEHSACSERERETSGKFLPPLSAANPGQTTEVRERRGQHQPQHVALPATGPYRRSLTRARQRHERGETGTG
jgi:hypothetical protein